MMKKTKKIELLTSEDKQLWFDYVKDIKKNPVNHSVNTASAKSVFINRINDYVLKNIIDLHGYTINEAYDTILSFIELNYKAGRRQIRIITGRGKSDYPETLNKLVPRWLKERPMSEYVVSSDFTENNPGELLIKLRKQK